MLSFEKGVYEKVPQPQGDIKLVPQFSAEAIRNQARGKLCFSFITKWPSHRPFWLTIIASLVAAFIAYRICVMYENRSAISCFTGSSLEFDLGNYSCMCGIGLGLICLCAGAGMIVFDKGLMNSWDLVYLVMLSFITAAGGFYHIYFGYSFEMLGFKDSETEKHFLKLDHEEQKTLLNTSAIMVLKFIAGIIIVILVLSYRKYLLGDKVFTVFHTCMLSFNVLQAVFLIIGVHIHMTGKYLWRMEQAKLRLLALSREGKD